MSVTQGIGRMISRILTEKATFAGGCFWCMEAAFDGSEGMISVVSGFSGGDLENPSYEQVITGRSGHKESVQITFDPSKIIYSKLLDNFWKNIDPTDTRGQFVDHGSQYQTAIFYHSEEQKMLAEKSKKELQESGIFDKPIVTKILEFKNFYTAEDYHQAYYKKNTLNYNMYKLGSGRKEFFENVWKKKEFNTPSEMDISKLTPLQYEVTQLCSTEKPFRNEYWNNKAEGIYVDIISGKPLFSSIDKFDSCTGWPSFSQPLEMKNIIEKDDKCLGIVRTEVKSKDTNSHLGHVFTDGPEPTRLRYCINSASLRFIPKKDLEKNGYGNYLKIFKK